MGVCWEPAGLPEMIWSHIVDHLDVEEYARMSGTCKVFSDLQPYVPNICVDSNLTVEEWNFVTRRCSLGDCHLNLTDGVAIHFLGPFHVYSAQHPAQPLRVLTVATEGAIPEAGPQEALLKHLAAQGSLQHLRVLRTTNQGYAGKGEEDEPLNPLLSALDAKVPSAKGQLSRLPFCDSLTHLIVKTDRMERVLAQLPSFRALRMLCLEHSKTERIALPPGMGVDLTGVPTLKHFAIVNWYADSIRGPEGCKLHASYDPNGFGGPSRAAPFVFSGMWASKNLPLASFFLIDQNGGQDAALEALDKILSQDGPLDFVYVELDHAFGSSRKPLEISEQRWRGLLTASNLRLFTWEGCILCLPGACPAWKCLNIISEGEIDLSRQSMGHLVAGLKSFYLSGRVPLSLSDQLSAELARTGRQCHVSAHSPISSDDENHIARNPRNGLFDVTNVSEADQESFDLSMSCGCQCCLLCLRSSGVLPREFHVIPKTWSPFGTLLEEDE